MRKCFWINWWKRRSTTSEERQFPDPFRFESVRVRNKSCHVACSALDVWLLQSIRIWNWKWMWKFHLAMHICKTCNCMFVSIVWRVLPVDPWGTMFRRDRSPKHKLMLQLRDQRFELLWVVHKWRERHSRKVAVLNSKWERRAGSGEKEIRIK